MKPAPKPCFPRPKIGASFKACAVAVIEANGFPRPKIGASFKEGDVVAAEVEVFPDPKSGHHLRDIAR